MNEDHSDAILLYAQAFGGVQNAVAAQMVSIDAEGMILTVKVDAAEQPVRVEFDHTLADAEDAHQTLIAMVKQARSKAK